MSEGQNDETTDGAGDATDDAGTDGGTGDGGTPTPGYRATCELNGNHLKAWQGPWRAERTDADADGTAHVKGVRFKDECTIVIETRI